MFNRWIQKHAFITSFCAGVVSTLGFAPYGLYFCTLLGVGGLYRLLRQTTHPFKTGYCFGLGFFGFSLYWVNNALMVDLSRFWWIIPIGLTAIPATLGLFSGLTGWVFSHLTSRWSGPWTKPLAFSFIWISVEWLCGHYFFTGFPWCLVGYTWTDLLPICQLASLTGIYGLSLFTCLLAGYLSEFFIQREGKFFPHCSLIIVPLVLFGLIFGWGYYRLKCHPTHYHPNVSLRLVQPNIEQSRKWNFDATHEVFQEHLNLSETRAIDKPIHLVILPESAISWSPKFLEQDNDRRTYMGSYLQQGTWMIAGTPRFEPSLAGGDVYNGLLAIGSNGDIEARFNKFHLLPFGEYLPFRDLFEAVAPGLFHKFTAGERDFTPGPGPVTLTLGSLPPFSPLICYEAIFPQQVVHPNKPRPEWLLNITNDGWFGTSVGPHQHLSIARMRAIEEGLPMARVANTGVSAMIDPCGRILERLEIETRGILDVQLPLSLKKKTFYANYGDSILLFGFILFSFIILVCNTLWALGKKQRHFDIVNREVE